MFVNGAGQHLFADPRLTEQQDADLRLRGATGVYLVMTSTDKSASVSSTESNLTFDISTRGVTIGGRF